MFFTKHIKKEFVICNELGLHARPATMFVQLAMKFKSDILVTNIDCDRSADGKSVLAMLMLASPKGSKISVEIKGDDCEDAMDAIQKLVEDGFGE